MRQNAPGAAAPVDWFVLSLPTNTEPFIVRPVTQSAATTALDAAHVTAEALNLAVLRITALGGARTRLALHDARRPSSDAIGGAAPFGTRLGADTAHGLF